MNYVQTFCRWPLSNFWHLEITLVSRFNEHPWLTPILIFFFFLPCSCGVDIFSPVISCMWGRDAMQWKHNLWHRRGNYPAVWNSEDIKRWHLFANNPNIVQVLKHRKKIRTTMSITCPRFDLVWNALISQQWVRTVTYQGYQCFKTSSLHDH